MIDEMEVGGTDDARDGVRTATREDSQQLHELLDAEPGPLPARAADVAPRVVGRTDDPPRGISLGNTPVIVRYSEHCELLFAALAEAQAMDDYGDVEKSKTARVASKKGEGSSYSYDYETLADVIDATRPFLAKCGIATLQFPFPGQRSVTIRTMLAHKSGQWIYNDLSAVISMPDPQAVGSGISYLRRYALKSICGVAARDEDDDGELASAPNRPTGQPMPSQRRSQQQAQQERPQERAEPSRPSAAAPKNVGTIVDVDQRGNGMLVKLSTGYVFQTKDQELMRAVKTYRENGATVEATCRPSSDPSKFAPVLEELVQQRKS